MPSDLGLDYLLALALWPAVLVFLVARAWRGRYPVAGLSFAYWLQFALIHLLGGLIQLVPGYESLERRNTMLGFPLTGYALAGFFVGQFLVRPSWLLPVPRHTKATPCERKLVTLGFSSIALGAVAYFVLSGVARAIPSMTSIVSNGLNLVVGGFVLIWWYYYRSGQRGKAWAAAAAILFVPFVTVILRGFLGFGVFAVMSMSAFVAVHYVPRRTIIVGGAVLAVLGLSLWVAYFNARNDIRAAVWGQEDFSTRLKVTAGGIQEEWSVFDVDNDRHLNSIEERLNQNVLVGAARRRVEAEEVELAHGETLLNGVLALIPRAMWPEKPSLAGSGRLVTRFTGIRFDTTTSVGIGHLMELYVNFGERGVFLGFVIIGGVLSALDFACGRYLRAGRLEGFLICFLVGQTLLSVGGLIAEAPPAAIGSVILCLFLTRYLHPIAAPIAVPGPRTLLPPS